MKYNEMVHKMKKKLGKIEANISLIYNK